MLWSRWRSGATSTATGSKWSDELVLLLISHSCCSRCCWTRRGAAHLVVWIHLFDLKVCSSFYHQDVSFSNIYLRNKRTKVTFNEKLVTNAIVLRHLSCTKIKCIQQNVSVSCYCLIDLIDLVIIRFYFYFFYAFCNHFSLWTLVLRLIPWEDSNITNTTPPKPDTSLTRTISNNFRNNS